MSVSRHRIPVNWEEEKASMWIWYFPGGTSIGSISEWEMSNSPAEMGHLKVSESIFPKFSQMLNRAETRVNPPYFTTTFATSSGPMGLLRYPLMEMVNFRPLMGGSGFTERRLSWKVSLSAPQDCHDKGKTTFGLPFFQVEWCFELK